MDVKLLQQSLPLPGLELDQYVGLWAIDETAGMQLFDHARRLDLAGHVAQTQNAGRDIAAATVADQAADELTIAVIDIRGTMTKRGSSLSDAGSTVLIRREVRQAARDGAVDGIVLRIDSPGGTVSGTADLAAEVAEANRRKPVYAFAEDTTASAAYWVASQAEKIYANNRTAKVGSIGTLLYLYDLSGMAEKEGVRPVVIKTGDMKGVGVPGAAVSEQHEAYLQEIVDQTQAEFTAGVMAGRNMHSEQVAAVATGRVYNAGEAQRVGLIDGIESFDQTLALLAAEIRGRRRNSRGSQMSAEQESQQGPQPATFKELKAAFPNATAEFLTAQLEADATIDQARAAYTKALEERAAAAEARAQEAETAAKQAEASKAPGVDGLPEGQSQSTDADAGDFRALVAAAARERNIPTHLAARQIAREHPEARQAAVAEHNARHARSR